MTGIAPGQARVLDLFCYRATGARARRVVRVFSQGGRVYQLAVDAPTVLSTGFAGLYQQGVTGVFYALLQLGGEIPAG